MGVPPIAGWLLGKNTVEWMILGVPPIYGNPQAPMQDLTKS